MEIKFVCADTSDLSKSAKKKDKQKSLKCQREYIRESKKISITGNKTINISKKD